MSKSVEESRQGYIDKVKAMGQEIINRADDIIGEFDMVCGLSVSFTFLPNGVPTLEVKREYLSKEYLRLGVKKEYTDVRKSDNDYSESV